MDKPDRRQAILDGVISLLAERGLEGVTHRAVDQVSGLPQGSTSYYFPRKFALLVDASKRLASLLEEDCDDLQIGFAKAVAEDGWDAAMDYVAGELVAYADDARHLFLARIELTLAASRRSELADVGTQLTTAARRPIEFFLRLISERRQDMPIAACAGLIDGITLMYATGQAPKPTGEQVAAAFRAML